MKKHEIIKNNDVFNEIINKGNKVSTTYFIICRVNNSSSSPSFGVAVGKKVGNAVIRNKIKRQIRVIIDKNKKLFSNNFNYIIIGKKRCVNAIFNEMNNDMINYLEKVKNEK